MYILYYYNNIIIAYHIFSPINEGTKCNFVIVIL